MPIEDFSNILIKKPYPVLCPDEKELVDLFYQVRHSEQDINKLLSDAWLGIYANDDTLFNPLNNLPPQAADNFTQYLVWLMSQPDYFYFIIKCLFNMNSFPFQCLLLREMFNHRYPLIIASRGAAKCVLGDSLIYTNAGIKRIDELVPEKIVGIKQDCPYKAFGETGYRDIEYSFYNGKKPTKVIQTKSGRKLEATLNHPIRAVRGGEIVWVKSEDLKVGDHTIISGLPDWYLYIDDINEEDVRLLAENVSYTDNSLPQRVFSLSKPSLILFVDYLLEINNNSFFSLNLIREIQVLTTALGWNSYINPSNNGYDLIIDKSFFNNIDEITSITDSENDTYDIHIDNDDHSFISNGFISHNSSTLGLYILISMIIRPNVKIVITGAGFRQAKLVFQYMEDVWNKSPVLRSCFPGQINGAKHGTDSWQFRLGNSITYALPVGPDGSKVRGYRANILVADEFSSLNRTVFEEVMSGFLAVSADPIEQMSQRAKSSLINKLPDYATEHLRKDNEYDPYQLNNQLILSGTAYYKHNHFYEYYKKWRDIISSAGDPEKLNTLLGGDYDPANLNWKDYSIFRVPIELTTSGFMDMSQISRIKASTTKDVYAREYSAIFTDDSDGFYRRSLIDSCTISDKNVVVKNNEEIRFGAVLYGDPNKKYIYGVDPAYEGDNFAIVVLECEKEYRKVVHVWTTQASDHKQLLADKIITENDYYHYAARKIRNLMKRFPCAYIAIDTQGGGRAVIEALSDHTKLEAGELMILPYIDPTQPPKDSDSMKGDHIIYEVKPTSDWNIEANHSLKKDMEMKDILFPAHDGISYSMAEFYDNSMGKYSGLYDTLEDCIYEIEELKNELTMIAVTETATGKQRFDTPEVKIGITKKGKLRKDRYSALLMANYVARNMEVLIPRRISSDMFGEGGFAKPSVFISGNSSVGNPNIINQFEQLYDAQLSARQ